MPVSVVFILNGRLYPASRAVSEDRTSTKTVNIMVLRSSLIMVLCFLMNLM